MKKTGFSAVLLAFLMAAPAFAEVQHFYCHSQDRVSAYQVAGVVVDDAHLGQVFLVTLGDEGQPVTTEIGDLIATAGPDYNSFNLNNRTLRLPTNLSKLDYKAVSGSLVIDNDEELVSLACFTNTSL